MKISAPPKEAPATEKPMTEEDPHAQRFGPMDDAELATVQAAVDAGRFLFGPEVKRLLATLTAARASLETERMRVVACDVVALADTPESAKKAREMHADYRSAALDSVIRRVDECIALRASLGAAEERALSGDEVLGMIRGRLEDVGCLHGHDQSATPPYSYNDAISCVALHYYKRGFREGQAAGKDAPVPEQVTFRPEVTREALAREGEGR